MTNFRMGSSVRKIFLLLVFEQAWCHYQVINLINVGQSKRDLSRVLSQLFPGVGHREKDNFRMVKELSKLRTQHKTVQTLGTRVQPVQLLAFFFVNTWRKHPFVDTWRKSPFVDTWHKSRCEKRGAARRGELDVEGLSHCLLRNHINCHRRV